MNRSTWKAQERWVAQFFGSTRTPLSGSGSRHTGSDSLHPRLYIETKLRKGFTAACRRFQEIAKEAKKEGKIPVLVFRIQGQDNLDSLAVVRLRDLKAVAQEIPN